MPDLKRHSMRVVGSSRGGAARKRRSSWTTRPEVVGVDERRQLGADEVLGVAAVDPGRRGADVAQHAAGLGDHDDVAGALDQGAEVVLLLGQFLGERDVVEEHDAPAGATRASTTVQPVRTTTRSTRRPSTTLYRMPSVQTAAAR